MLNSYNKTLQKFTQKQQTCAEINGMLMTYIRGDIPMHGGRRRAGNDFIYRGAKYSSRLTQGAVEDAGQYFPGLSDYVGNRVILWFGPKKMALAYHCGNGVLGKFNLKQFLAAVKNQNCDVLVFNRDQIAEHQLHIRGSTNGAGNFYRKQIIPATKIDISDVSSNCEIAVILPEGESVLRLQNGAVKYSHGNHYGSHPDKKNRATNKARQTHPGDYHFAVLRRSGKLENPFLDIFHSALRRLQNQLQKIHDKHIQIKYSDYHDIDRNKQITDMIPGIIKSLKILGMKLNAKKEHPCEWEISHIRNEYSKLCQEITVKLNLFLQKEEKIFPPNITLKKHALQKQGPQPLNAELKPDLSLF